MLKSMKQKFVILLALLMSAVTSAFAQNMPTSDTVSMRVFYKQGHATFDPSYMGNGVNLENFIGKIREIRKDPMSRVRAIRIYAGASPEGSSDINQKLSEKRAENIAEVLQEYFPDDQGLFYVNAVGVDWEGLEQMVMRASDMPYRDEVLDILRNTPEWVTENGAVVDSRKRQLTSLHNGKAWWYMYDNLFPELRGAGGRIAVEIEYMPKGIVDLSVQEFLDDSVFKRPPPVIEALPVVKRTPQPFYMALKTNLLYDVALVPNLGVEFYLGKGWTIGANGAFAWWKVDSKDYFWRVYGGDFSIRKYFGRAAKAKPLTGHHLGLYGQALSYDFELGGTGYLSDMSYGGGIEYGYSFPIAKRLNLDLGIGIGYLGGEYKKYTPMDGHYVWQETRQRHWFGPTKAEITLVWLIGRGNYNKGK